MSTSMQLGRTYNQVHISRQYIPGRRRFSIYITWSYPAEANKDLTQLDNRFSSMTEVRRVGWPAFEAPEFLDYRELYPFLVWPALGLVLVEVGLAETVLRKLP